MLAFQILVDRFPFGHIIGELAILLNVHVFVAPIPITGIFGNFFAGKCACIQLLLQEQGEAGGQGKIYKG